MYIHEKQGLFKHTSRIVKVPDKLTIKTLYQKWINFYQGRSSLATRLTKNQIEFLMVKQILLYPIVIGEFL